MRIESYRLVFTKEDFLMLAGGYWVSKVKLRESFGGYKCKIIKTSDKINLSRYI